MAKAFEEMGVCAELLRVVSEHEWLVPTPVQTEVIPLMLGGGDVLAAAETVRAMPSNPQVREWLCRHGLFLIDVLVDGEQGSGKTGAFMIPLLQVIQETLLDAQASPLSGSNSSNAAASETRAAVTTKSKSNHKPQIQWNADDKDVRLTIASQAGGSKCSSSDDKSWVGARATAGVRGRGKFFYECEVLPSLHSPDSATAGSNGAVCGGIVRVGWSTIAAAHDLGTDKHGYGYGGTGKKSHARQFDDYGEAFGAGDIIGCYLDLAQRVVRFSKNGKLWGDAFALDAMLGRKTPLFPAVSVKNAAVVANFGDNLAMRPFRFPPTTQEFVGVAQAQPEQLAINSTTSSDLEVMDRTSNTSTTKGNAVAAPLGIIVEPSRDLAQQVFVCAVAFKKYFVNPSLRVALAVGGISLKDQKRKIQQAGGCDLVVGTPGRLADMADEGVLDLSRVRFLVLDEVDQLIATDSVPAILKLHRRMPSQAVDCGLDRLQVCFFSATLHANGVLALSESICYHPLLVDLKGREFIPDTVHHVVLSVNSSDGLISSDQARCLPLALPPTDGVHDANVQNSVAKPMKHAQGSTAATFDGEAQSQAIKYLKPQLLVRVLQRLQIDQCMVFCRTNLDCDLLEQYLLSTGGGGTRFTGEKRESGKENELSCCVLAGMRSMASRQQALEAFKSGDIRILICTDVAARGIDVKHLACIINMTLPDSEENYIHRVGRVGRNDAMGLAISIVAEQDTDEKVWFHRCNKVKGKGCLNRKLVAQGGCTVWYNETAIKCSIEKRLHQSIPTVDSLVELERAIEKLGGMKQYGVEREALAQEASPELQKLAPAVQKLATLEEGVQHSWLHMQMLLQKPQQKP